MATRDIQVRLGDIDPNDGAVPMLGQPNCTAAKAAACVDDMISAIYAADICEYFIQAQ